MEDPSLIVRDGVDPSTSRCFRPDHPVDPPPMGIAHSGIASAGPPGRLPPDAHRRSPKLAGPGVMPPASCFGSDTRPSTRRTDPWPQSLRSGYRDHRVEEGTRPDDR